MTPIAIELCFAISEASLLALSLRVLGQVKSCFSQIETGGLKTTQPGRRDYANSEKM